MSFISFIVTTAVTAGSGYAAYFAALSVPKLQTYEQRAEKAAGWSSAAGHHLWQTRYTVAAGLAFSLFSLYNATSFLLFTSKELFFRNALWSLVLAGGSHAVARYIRNYWKPASTPKIPLLEDYNHAIEDLAEVLRALDILMVGWLVMVPLKLFKV